MRYLWVVTVAASVLIIAPPLAMARSDSSLSQSIVRTNCELDPHAPGCLPEVESIDVNQGRPIVAGFFDAATATELHVEVAGIVYTLGQNAELVATGDQWVLDLSNLIEPLEPGEYTVAVTVISATDERLTASRIFSVAISTEDDPEADEPDGETGDGTDTGDDESQPSLGDRLTDTGDPVFWIALAGGGALIVAIAMLVLARKNKRRS